MATTQEESDLASQLHKWAMEEMHFQPQGRHVNARLPSAEDFKPICRGQVREVWKFALKHICSVQTVHKVQGNLILKNKQSSAGYNVSQPASKERTALLEERRHLSSQLNITMSSINLLEQDVSRLTQDILNTEQSLREAQCRAQDQQNRAAILRGHSHRISKEVAKFNEYSNQIRSKTESYTTLSKSGEKAQYFSKQPIGESSESGALESACTRQVRETCEHIATFLGKLVQGDFSKEKEMMEVQREHLWKLIDQLCSSYPPVQLLLSLTNYTQDSTLGLHQRTAAIDIRKDVEKLRFKYEKSGELLDTSSPPSALQSVHQLMEESQANHFRQFLMTEKSENKAWMLQKRLSQTTNVIYTKLQQSCNDPGAAQLARSIFDAELQTAGYRAALQTLNEIAEDLRGSIAKAAQEKELLYLKYQKIQDFKLLVEKKQDVIRMLLKENLSSRTHVDSQQALILKYVQSALGNHDANVRSLSSQVNDGVLKEVETFAKLSLPCLALTSLDSGQKLCVEDFSINKVNRVSYGLPAEQANILAHVLQTLAFPRYKAAECVLPWMVSLQEEVDDLSITLQACHSHGHASPAHRQRHREALDHIAELCREVRHRDREALEKVLPVLQKHVAQATQALSDCLKLRDTVQSWWEQPAQSTVTWLSVEDQNLQQWRDKWTVAVTHLRQLNIKPTGASHGSEFAF